MLSPHDVNRAFGEALRKAREKADLTQSELAKSSGIGRTTIANMELGAQAATTFQIARLAQSLGVSPSVLIPDLSRELASDDDFERFMRHRKIILAQ